MLLQKLVEYADGMNPPAPPFYEKRSIRYIVELDGSGKLLGLTDTADLSDRRTKNGTWRFAPQRKRSGTNAPPILLADHAGYSLGLSVPNKMDDQKASRCFNAYKNLLGQCAEATGVQAARSVLTFLGNAPADQLQKHDLDRFDTLDRAANWTFRVDGTFVIDNTSVEEFWAREVIQPQASGSAVMECMVCGRIGDVLRVHPVQIHLTGGASDLVSADKSAFQSYGMDSSYNAPTCAPCVEKYARALNHLVNTPANNYRIGGMVFIFWTRKETGFSFRSFFEKPDPEEVRALIESLWKGKTAGVEDESEFYALQLRRTESRVVVRDWMDTTVGDVKNNLAQWFQMQQIVALDGSEHVPMSLKWLAEATVRRNKKTRKPDMNTLAPSVPRDLIRTALTGAPLPHTILYQTIDRSCAERDVTHERAALIKLALMSRSTEHDYKEGEMVSLNEEHPVAAYHCGRLLAELEAAQYQALGRVNANITDRFFRTASMAPATVLPVLVDGAQAHLSKLRKSKEGAHAGLQQRIQEIVDRIDGYPRTLSLEERGLFQVGYYHQRAHDRAQADKAKDQRRRAEQADGKDEAEE